MSFVGGRCEVVDVFRRSTGRLWSRKVTPPGDGLALEISHSVASSASLSNPHLVRFVQATFDVSGSRLLAVDLQGNVFVFNLAANSFSRVMCFGSACTAVAFSRRCVDEVMVATADASLKIINVAAKEIVACLKGHVDPIQSVSVHHSGRYVVTSSEDTAQLWDLDTLERKRKLTVKNSPGVLKVFFIDSSNDIITAFRDDSIFCWDAESLTCKFALPSTVGAGEASPLYRDVAANGRHLVAAGRSRNVAIFSLESKTLLRVAQLPSKLVNSVKSVAFLPSTLPGPSTEPASTALTSPSSTSSFVVVLSHSGSLLLLDIHTCQIVVLFDASEQPDSERIKDLAVSPTGRHLLTCTDKMKLYLVDKLLTSRQRPLKSKAPPSTAATRCKGRRLTPASKHVTVSARARKKKLEDLECIEKAEPLTPAKLKHMLATFGQFPSKYRLFIWRMILKLPENHQAFASLVDKGTHPAFENLQETYPIKDHRLFRAFQKTLSHLAHWAPICGESSIIPLVAFPFVKLFVHNQLLCFEVVAAVILNHLQHFFEYYPNPPVNVLAACENLLCFHAPALLEHFAANGVTAVVYAWPLLETLFSEILTADDWLIFFDFALMSHPCFILFAVVAFSILNKNALMACNYREDFRFFFRHHSAVSVASLVSATERLFSSTPAKIHPAKNGFFDDFTPLPNRQYPIFNGYPEMIVNYQIREKDRVAKENEEIQRQEGIVRDIERRAAARHIKDNSFRLPKESHLASKSELQQILRLGSSASEAESQRRQIEAAMQRVQQTEMRLLNATRKKLLLSGPSKNASETEVKTLNDDRSEALQSQENKENVIDPASQTTDGVDADIASSSSSPSQHQLLSSGASSGERLEFSREGRETFEARQRQLLQNIQTLRAKLAASSSGSRVRTPSPSREGVKDSCGDDAVHEGGVDAVGGGGDAGPSTKTAFTSAFVSPFALIGGGDGI